MRGESLPKGLHRGHVEVYSSGRYTTVTGWHVGGTLFTIESRDTLQLQKVVAAGVYDFDSNPKLKSLLNGRWQEVGIYPSQSEADLAFADLLAAKLDNNKDDIDFAFRLSGLYREKWDEMHGDCTYGEQTIQKALESRQPEQARLAGENPTGANSTLLRNEDGKLKALLSNACELLRTHPAWQGVLGFDKFNLQLVVLKPTPWGSPAGPWNDTSDIRATCWLQKAGLAINVRIAADAVQAVGEENPFHPVKNYLQAIAWDSTPRLESWLSRHLGVANSPYSRAIGPRWLISAVARIFRPGCQADHTLLLEGPQGAGKSSALRILAGEQWFSDHISALGSKDSRGDLPGKWIIEMSELSNLRRAEIETVKSFLTACVDHYRKPYGRRSEDVPRSCVFAASTNDESPFTDETGNRRFWPVRCGTIDLEALRRDRDQLWAEAYLRFQKGEPWWLDSAELAQLAGAEQESRYETDPWEPIILGWCRDPRQSIPSVADFNSREPVPWGGSTRDKVNVTDILVHALAITPDRIKQADAKRVARCLRHAGWQMKQERSVPNRGKRYYVPPPPDGNPTDSATSAPVSPSVTDRDEQIKSRLQ